MSRELLNIKGVIFSFKKKTQEEYSEFISLAELSVDNVLNFFKILVVEFKNIDDITNDIWDLLYDMLLSLLFYYPRLILE